ncbi:MAG: hydroxymethylpyrimidine/phosphomethylpyrimidine kinase, partial [Chlamydiales bacterium]
MTSCYNASIRPFRVLTIAGSDSGGGAGIQADLKTISALGCYATSVLTALTAQNTQEVLSVYPVSADFVGEQLDAVLTDIGTDAIKIGMLQDISIIKMIAAKLDYFDSVPVVLDPVMISTSGTCLLGRDAIKDLIALLFPLATLLTPNLPEASRLLGRRVEVKEQMEEAALEIQEMGARAVLLKGGHLKSGKGCDCLAIDSTIHWIESLEVQTRNTHGTGCTYSSAIAAYLAKGFELLDAVTFAKHYLTAVIEAGSNFTIGKGFGPVHHFYDLWKIEEARC